MEVKIYNEQYRRSAVELAEFSGKQLKEVAQDMGIDVTTLRRWRRQFIGKIQPLKTECFHQGIPKTHKEAHLMLFDYIETFYNTKRLHSSLGFKSPVDFEKQLN